MLVALWLLDESYPRELARLLDVSLNGVQQALRGLEVDGLVAVRTSGRMRLCRINPRFFARKELGTYLGRLAETELVDRATTLKRRPRRGGKPR